MRVQWLGIRLAVGATGSILGQGTKIQNATQHDQKRWGGGERKNNNTERFIQQNWM